MPDVVYKTEAGKYRAVIKQIEGVPRKGPAGAGGYHYHREIRACFPSCSKNAHIKHNVLNAKHHEKEAEIVAQAGKKGAVTIATNMAGRGTDIMLGGNAEFLAKAGNAAAWQFSDELIAEATGFAETDDRGDPERPPDFPGAGKEV